MDVITIESDAFKQIMSRLDTIAGEIEKRIITYQRNGEEV